MGHTSKEAVELDEELKIDVVALGRFAVRATHMVLVEIDTCDSWLGQLSCVRLDVGATIDLHMRLED